MAIGSGGGYFLVRGRNPALRSASSAAREPVPVSDGVVAVGVVAVAVRPPVVVEGRIVVGVPGMTAFVVVGGGVITPPRPAALLVPVVVMRIVPRLAPGTIGVVVMIGGVVMATFSK